MDPRGSEAVGGGGNHERDGGEREGNGAFPAGGGPRDCLRGALQEVDSNERFVYNLGDFAAFEKIPRANP